MKHLNTFILFGSLLFCVALLLLLPRASALHVHQPTEIYRRQSNASEIIDAIMENLDDAALLAFAAVLNTALGRFPILTNAIQLLGVGDKTFFIPLLGPSDLGQLSDFWEDPDLILRTLYYHIIDGRYDESSGWAHYPQRTLLATALNEGQRLEANGSQPLITAIAPDGKLYVYNQGEQVEITAMQSVPRLNINLALVDKLLEVPRSGRDTFARLSSELSEFGSLLNKTQRVDFLEQQQGVTIFAPNSSAFSAHADFFQRATNDELVVVVGNHVLEGKSVYSNGFSDSHTFDTSSRHTIQLVTDGTGENGTGLAVIFDGNTRASVLQADILIENGVLHIIDGININTSDGSSTVALSQGVALFSIGISMLLVLVQL
ncbi:hypothetical protein AX16_004893 [Volvariella volvacea WC 439]|nr:hypothetical protein AX16_004893 [Volvariella volvacea WC 439]